MGFHEIQFPSGISYGSQGGPVFNTSVVEVSSGAEERIARWGSPRYEYDAAYGVRSESDLSALRAFHIARQGRTHGFRWKDWDDFTTGANDTGAPTKDDVLIGTGDGSTADYQLVKLYTSGAITRTRTITKPVVGTVLIAFDGVNQASGWTVEPTTGVVTFTPDVSAGVTEITAGFEFDVPVRFGSDSLPVLRDDYGSRSVNGGVPIREVVEDTSQADEFFFGSGTTQAFSDTLTISPAMGRCIRLQPASALTVVLPQVGTYPTGGPWFYLWNDSAFTVTVEYGGSTVFSMTTQTFKTVNLWPNGSGKEWQGQ